jgi:hypothetical protein
MAAAPLCQVVFRRLGRWLNAISYFICPALTLFFGPKGDKNGASRRARKNTRAARTKLIVGRKPRVVVLVVVGRYITWWLVRLLLLLRNNLFLLHIYAQKARQTPV